MSMTVDATISHGNACDIEVREEGNTALVEFAADPHGGPECLWFCFRVRRDEGTFDPQVGKVQLVLKHFGNILGGSDPSAIRPVARYEGDAWQRLEPGTADNSPDGRVRACWTIEAPTSYVDVALCYPYGRADLHELVNETDGFWRCDTIGVSQAARSILRLSNDYGAIDGDRPGLYLIARQHSGETPGSWVLDGFLRQIATLGKDAPLVWAVPLSNIDGVEQGDYGKDNFPYDLNRAWGQPPMRHETLIIQRDMRRWQKRCRPVLGIDFHAPGACETDGIYMYLPTPENYPTEHELADRWTARMAGALTHKFAAEPANRVARYRSRWETPGFVGYCCDELKLCALTIETPYASANGTLLTQDAYRQAGQRLADTVAAHITRGPE